MTHILNICLVITQDFDSHRQAWTQAHVFMHATTQYVFYFLPSMQNMLCSATSPYKICCRVIFAKALRRAFCFLSPPPTTHSSAHSRVLKINEGQM